MTDSLGSPRDAREVVARALRSLRTPSATGASVAGSDNPTRGWGDANSVLAALKSEGWTLLPPPGSTEWETLVERGAEALRCFAEEYPDPYDMAESVLRAVLSALTETKET